MGKKLFRKNTIFAWPFPWLFQSDVMPFDIDVQIQKQYNS